MTKHPFEPRALDPQRDERELDTDRLSLDQPGAEPISAHDIETGLRLQNWLWFIANHGIGSVSKR